MKLAHPSVALILAASALLLALSVSAVSEECSGEMGLCPLTKEHGPQTNTSTVLELETVDDSNLPKPDTVKRRRKRSNADPAIQGIWKAFLGLVNDAAVDEEFGETGEKTRALRSTPDVKNASKNDEGYMIHRHQRDTADQQAFSSKSASAEQEAEQRSAEDIAKNKHSSKQRKRPGRDVKGAKKERILIQMPAIFLDRVPTLKRLERGSSKADDHVEVQNESSEAKKRDVKDSEIKPSSKANIKEKRAPQAGKQQKMPTTTTAEPHVTLWLYPGHARLSKEIEASIKEVESKQRKGPASHHRQRASGSMAAMNQEHVALESEAEVKQQKHSGMKLHQHADNQDIHQSLMARRGKKSVPVIKMTEKQLQAFLASKARIRRRTDDYDFDSSWEDEADDDRYSGEIREKKRPQYLVVKSRQSSKSREKKKKRKNTKYIVRKSNTKKSSKVSHQKTKKSLIKSKQQDLLADKKRLEQENKLLQKEFKKKQQQLKDKTKDLAKKVSDLKETIKIEPHQQSAWAEGVNKGYVNAFRNQDYGDVRNHQAYYPGFPIMANQQVDPMFYGPVVDGTGGFGYQQEGTVENQPDYQPAEPQAMPSSMVQGPQVPMGVPQQQAGTSAAPCLNLMFEICVVDDNGTTVVDNNGKGQRSLVVGGAPGSNAMPSAIHQQLPVPAEGGIVTRSAPSHPASGVAAKATFIGPAVRGPNGTPQVDYLCSLVDTYHKFTFRPVAAAAGQVAT